MLGRVPEDLCREVDDFIIQSGTNKVIEAVWDNAQEVFVLRATGMKKSTGRPSAVTTVEDVSSHLLCAQLTCAGVRCHMCRVRTCLTASDCGRSLL